MKTTWTNADDKYAYLVATTNPVMTTPPQMSASVCKQAQMILATIIDEHCDARQTCNSN